MVAGPVDHRRRGAFRAQRVALAVGGRELEIGGPFPNRSRHRRQAIPSAERGRSERLAQVLRIGER